MDSIFKICKNGECGIDIIGLEKDNQEYISEDNDILSYRAYKFSESITINVVRSISSDNEYTSEIVELVSHDINSIDQVTVQFEKDGLYEISHIILPTEAYVKTYKDSVENNYKSLYYFDTVDDNYKLYIKDTDTSTIVTLAEILEVNPNSEDLNTIIRSDQNTFCLCYLNRCFYELCKLVLNKFCGKCINKLEYNKLDVYNRDIIFMAINVIKYLIGFGQYFEAQRILESISQCGNICKPQNFNKEGGDCGCYSRT